VVANPLNVCEPPDPPPSFESYYIYSNNEEVSSTPSSEVTGAEYFEEVELQGQQQSLENESKEVSGIYTNWILLGVIYDCDLTTKARNAEQSGYAGLIVQKIGTNNSALPSWHIMRFPLPKINHVVVGEYDGALLRNNYSYPDNRYV
jgi:hypothetical protein